MDRIPISFDYKGQQYKGQLQEVAGAAAKVWHLMINNYYRGCLMIVNDDWVFHSNSGELEDIAERFGEQVMLWYE